MIRFHRPRELPVIWSPPVAVLSFAPWYALPFTDWPPDWFGLGFATVISLLWTEAVCRPTLNGSLARLGSFRNAHHAAKKDHGRYVLVLRSFRQIHGHTDKESGFGVLWLLDGAVRATGMRLVLLGTDMSLPPEHSSLQVPTADADWHATFLRYGEGAALIVVIPETTPSLLTEMTELRSRGWLAKTVILMNGRAFPILSVGQDGLVTALGGNDDARAQRWDKARDHLRRIGVLLPAYDEEGALVALDRNGAIASYRPLGIDADLKTPGYFDILLKDIGPALPRRREKFARIWTQFAMEHAVEGRPLSEVYDTLAVEPFRLVDIWSPPGDERKTRILFTVTIAFGWLLPAFLFIRSY